MVAWANESGFQADTAEGELIGPFNPMLYSPKISAAEIAFLERSRENTALGQDRARGGDPDHGRDLGRGVRDLRPSCRREEGGSEHRRSSKRSRRGRRGDVVHRRSVAHEFTRSLVADHKVDRELYLRAVEAFGEKGVVDMIYLAGNYMTVSALPERIRGARAGEGRMKAEGRKPNAESRWARVE